MFSFKITKKDKKTLARTGMIKTPRGIIYTPAFMPVATCGAIKGIPAERMKKLGADILLCNTYHLWLRPGCETVAKFGGLHKFMNWDGPVITDSGGFQAFSLGYGLEEGIGKIPQKDLVSKKIKKTKLAKISEDGVRFKSHIDGKPLFLTPELSIQIQHKLGSDIVLVLDECTSPFASYEYTRDSLELTHRWGKRGLDEHKRLLAKTGEGRALFGILQGGKFDDLRLKAVDFVNSLDFDGFAIGGVFGDSKKDMRRILKLINSKLDEEKPRHLLGIAGIDDLFECVERGVDMFDCVSPSRLARQGILYVGPKSGGNKKNKWRIHIKNEKYKLDKKSVDSLCGCEVCKKYTRGYLNHLFKSGELLGLYLATEHNLYFILNLMKEIRQSLKNETFRDLKNKWLK